MEPVAMDANPTDPFFTPWLGAEDIELLQTIESPPVTQSPPQPAFHFAWGSQGDATEQLAPSQYRDSAAGCATRPQPQSLVRACTEPTKRFKSSPVDPPRLRQSPSDSAAPSDTSPPPTLPCADGDGALMTAEDIRKAKNRLKVRKHYYRKIDLLRSLRSTVQQLEGKYQKLLMDNQSTSVSSSLHRQEQLMDQLTASKRELEKENDQLRRLYSAQQVHFGWIKELLATQHDLFMTSQMAKTIFIKPFTKEECYAVRDKAYEDVMAVCSSLARTGHRPSRGTSLGGWQDEVTVEDGLWKFSLSKTVSGVTPLSICELTWPILRDPNGFARLFSASVEAKCVIVQEVDDGNVVMFQEYRTMDANNEYILMKSLFLVSRMQTETGSLFVMRGLGLDRVQDPDQFLPSSGYAASQVVWHDIFSWCKYDRTGLYGTDCAISFGGTAPTVGDNASFWSIEMLNIVSRWESAIYGPRKLLPSSDEDSEGSLQTEKSWRSVELL